MTSVANTGSLNANNNSHKDKTCTISDIKISFAWLVCAGIAVIFIVLDRLQNGNVTYQIYSNTQKDTFYCGFRLITYQF